jgi:hypothetical protein
VVASDVPPTWTTLLFRKPDPVTVSVCALEPAGTRLGLTDETAGVGVVVPPPLVELEPPPEHPLRTPSIPRVKTRPEKRTKNDNLRQAKNLTERAYLPITSR